MRFLETHHIFFIALKIANLFFKNDAIFDYQLHVATWNIVILVYYLFDVRKKNNTFYLRSGRNKTLITINFISNIHLFLYRVKLYYVRPCNCAVLT